MPPEVPPRWTVLLLVKGLGIGGAEKLISEGARHWDRTAFDYRVAYVLPWKNHLVPEFESLGIPTICLGADRAAVAVAAVRLRRLCREWEVDLVHAHLPWAGVIARAATGLPVVYTEHNLVGSYRPITRMINRLTYRRNAAATAVSQAVADSAAYYPGPPIEVVQNGVEVSSRRRSTVETRNELGLGPEDPLVVHVGNIRPGKGHEVLLDVAAELAARRSRATIVSIGGEKHRGDLSRLRREAAERGLDERLRFLGRREDALDFIAAADVYVNPADVEGMPVAVLEAMALARPIVATAVGGVPDLIGSDVTGILVPPRSPGRMADAVVAMLHDRSSSARLGKAAAKLVESEYGLRPMIRTFENVYRRVLA